MSWNTCKHPECENWTYRPDVDYCESHRRANDKAKTESKKQSEKRALQIQKAREKKPRKTISKNPREWKNGFLCSDGVRVTQVNINQMYAKHRGKQKAKCEGCGIEKAVCNAHIIAKARCKQIGKTELIWDSNNMYSSCFACNVAIENPKGKAWKSLKNIDKCLAFIKLHDPELYTKFELSAVNQEKQTI